MGVTIKQVKSRKELNSFISFPINLFKDVPGYVPAIRFDERDTLDPKKNPVYEFCESALFLAYKDGKIVGRVAAILNKKANSEWGIGLA